MAHSTDRPKAKSLRPLRALLPFLAPHRTLLLSALLALVIAGAALLILPLQLRQVIDHWLRSGSAGVINRYFVGFLIAGVVFGVFAALRLYLVTWLGERVVADLRE